jgi:hypothetical protein
MGVIGIHVTMTVGNYFFKILLLQIFTVRELILPRYATKQSDFQQILI